MVNAEVNKRVKIGVNRAVNIVVNKPVINPVNMMVNTHRQYRTMTTNALVSGAKAMPVGGQTVV